MTNRVRGLSVLLTGATDGIGRLTATALVERGARLIVHGRNPAKVERVVSELSTETLLVRGLVADLASLEATARLADEVAHLEPKLDVVIHNAGIGFGTARERREVSHDGFELRLAVNYLAPFVLTERLAKKGLPTRASIYLASIGQEALDFDDMQLEKRYAGVTAYRRSKIALVMLAFDQAERRPEVVSHVLHPGTLLATQMVIEAGIEPHGPASRGVESTLAVLDTAIAGGESGRYFDESHPARAHADAYDRSMRERLRTTSHALTEKFIDGPAR